MELTPSNTCPNASSSQSRSSTMHRRRKFIIRVPKKRKPAADRKLKKGFAVKKKQRESSIGNLATTPRTQNNEEACKTRQRSQ